MSEEAKICLAFLAMLFGSLIVLSCNDAKDKDKRIDWLQNQLDACMETRK